MREVDCQDIEAAVADLVIRANTQLPRDVYEALERACQVEESDIGRSCLEIILKNAELARSEGLALCQDTGTVSRKRQARTGNTYNRRESAGGYQPRSGQGVSGRILSGVGGR